jgi:hypothetical protein
MLHGRAVNEVVLYAPPKEATAGGEGVVFLGWRKVIEPLEDVARRYVGHRLAGKWVVATQEASVVLERPRPIPALAIFEEQRLGVIEGGVGRMGAPERFFGEHGLRPRPGGSEGRERPCADSFPAARGDEHDERFAVLAYTETEPLKGVVPVDARLRAADLRFS